MILTRFIGKGTAAAVVMFLVAVAAENLGAESSGSESALAEPQAAPRQAKKAHSKPARRVGVGVRLSTLGIGGEAAVLVSHRSNVRIGASLFSYSRGFSKDGVNYAANLDLRSVEAHYDWFPFAGRFHLSPGLMFYNGFQAKGSGTVPPGQSFTLGGTTYTSSPTDPVMSNAKIDFRKVAPTLMLGLGNLVPRGRRHFSMPFEVGVVFSGSPRTALSFRGTACDPSGLNCRNAATDPTVQSSVQSERQKINHDIEPFKVYPVISLGLSYSF